MSIQPVYFDIPPIFEAGLASGELVQFGGVLPDAGSMQIVKHLKPVRLPDEVSTDLLAKAAASLKNPWVIGGGILVLTVGSGIAWAVTANRRNARTLSQHLNESLTRYLEEARAGRLDEDTIAKLIDAIDDIKAAYGGSGDVIVLSIQQFETLMETIADYTQKLAEANSVGVSEILGDARGTDGESVVDLRRYLEAQREILRRAA